MPLGQSTQILPYMLNFFALCMIENNAPEVPKILSTGGSADVLGSDIVSTWLRESLLGWISARSIAESSITSPTSRRKYARRD